MRNYFGDLNNSDIGKQMTAHDEATMFLSFSKNTGQAIEEDELIYLQQDQEDGRITKSTTFDDMKLHTDHYGAHNQAMVMMNNPPSSKGFSFIEQHMYFSCHLCGSTYTKGYGDLRQYSDTTSTNQRATNTCIDITNTLDCTTDTSDLRWAIEMNLLSQTHPLSSNAMEMQLLQAQEVSLSIHPPPLPPYNPIGITTPAPTIDTYDPTPYIIVNTCDTALDKVIDI